MYYPCNVTTHISYYNNYLLYFIISASMFSTDFTVCGLAPLGDALVVVAFVTSGPKNDVSRTKLSPFCDCMCHSHEEIPCDAMYTVNSDEIL